MPPAPNLGMPPTPEQEARLLEECHKRGLGYPVLTVPEPGTDFWAVEFPRIPLRVEGWPGDGVDGFTHLLQQIQASAEIRRLTKLKIFGVTRL